MNNLMFFIIILFSFSIKAQEQFTVKEQPLKPKTIIRYEYIDRSHTQKEVVSHLGFAYGAMWAGYFVTQWDTIKNRGSFENYRENLGEITLDRDNPIWNLVGHPYTGSQTFLFFRGLGYEKMHAFQMAFWTSTLFEFTVEIYTEKASVQDLYQTPVLGSALGFGIEKLSFFLLNNDDYMFGKLVGHALNPLTLFGFGEIKTLIYPQISKNKQSLNFIINY